ncbi:MAG TPA: hypothetical protein VKA53_07995 [Thermoanaerobaculia bacterium]|nr:hypothetical protein [Thermoanaerobaculia bacterium]
MTRKTLLPWLSLALSALALVALFVGHLALTDVAHGEADLSQEWMALRLIFAFIGLASLVAIVTAARLLRDRRGR